MTMRRAKAAGSAVAGRPDKPGGQFMLREIRLGKWLFLGSFAIAFIAILQSLIKAQDLQCFGIMPNLCQLKLFEPSDALAVFTALMALFYTRKQIVDAQTPYLVYEGNADRRADTDLDAGDIFRITIRNAGSGTAIMHKVRYHLGIRGQDFRDLDYDDVIEQLHAAQLVPERHFMLRDISQGYALAKDGELIVFEMLRSRWDGIKWLDCDLDFRDVGGRLYRKQIFCVPRDRDKRFPASV